LESRIVSRCRASPFARGKSCGDKALESVRTVILQEDPPDDLLAVPEDTNDLPPHQPMSDPAKVWRVIASLSDRPDRAADLHPPNA
jgi:hypothetical protein